MFKTAVVLSFLILVGMAKDRHGWSWYAYKPSSSWYAARGHFDTYEDAAADWSRYAECVGVGPWSWEASE